MFLLLKFSIIFYWIVSLILLGFRGERGRYRDGPDRDNYSRRRSPRRSPYRGGQDYSPGAHPMGEGLGGIALGRFLILHMVAQTGSMLVDLGDVYLSILLKYTWTGFTKICWLLWCCDYQFAPYIQCIKLIGGSCCFCVTIWVCLFSKSHWKLEGTKVWKFQFEACKNLL